MNPDNSSHSEANPACRKFLTISLAGQGYCLPLTQVREIIRYQKVTAVPQLPPHVKGVINLRGRIIPLLDVRIQFGLPPVLSERTCIVVVMIPLANSRIGQVGLMVDTVEEVSTIAPQDIEPTPEFGNAARSEYLLGVAKIKGEVRMLLDIDRLFDAQILAAAAGAAVAAA